MVIFLHGEDIFRSRRKLGEIRQKYLISDKSGSGLSVFDCEEEKEAAGKIIDVLSTPNLLAPKRLLVVQNLIGAASAEEQKKVLEFLRKNAKSLVEDKGRVAVFWEKGAFQRSSAIHKVLEKNSKSQNFKKLTGVKLKQWTLKIMREISPQSQISKEALEKLLAFCGEDSFLLFSELQKLVNYADGEMIGRRDVEILVKAKLDSNIFQMVDAIGENNKKEALKLLHSRLTKGDDPFYLLSMFFYQFRNMLKVSDLYEKGVRSAYEISSTTKLHPFVAKKSLVQIARFPFSRLKDIYGKLGELDAGVKMGKIEIKLALDKFVAEL